MSSKELLSEWKVCILSEIGEVISGGTPKTNIEDYWNGDISWITPKDLSNFSNRYIKFGKRNISKKGLASSSANLLPRGTILFSSRAPIGYLAIADGELSTNQGFKNIVVNQDNDNLFVYYLLKKNAAYIEGMANGSTFKEISGKVFKSLEFVVPPLAEQKAIAHILSTLDDKIEVNNRINKTLENMAQAILKRWFVDFEFPNEEGEPYKSSGGEMVESELGLIPKGWGVSNIGSLSECVSKGTTPTKKDIDNAENTRNVIFLKVKDINNDGLINFNDIELIPKSVHENQLKRSILKLNDLLISIAGTIGRISYVNERLNNGNINQALAFIRLKNVRNYFLLVYLMIKNSDFQNSINTKIVQGVQANLSLTMIKNEKIILPKTRIIDAFNAIQNSIFQKRELLTEEMFLLTSIRDSLLPKLMTGEIRVPIEEL